MSNPADAIVFLISAIESSDKMGLMTPYKRFMSSSVADQLCVTVSTFPRTPMISRGGGKWYVASSGFERASSISLMPSCVIAYVPHGFYKP